jgi:aryl-alcohol dehydrogenase-like predicted oxidoreductase
MNMLDTAIAYGDSESVLGRVGVDKWSVVTKLPAVPIGCANVAEWINVQIESSMKRLRVSQLYGVLLHSPNQLLDSMGAHLYEVLQSLKLQNLTKKIGVSVYGVNELDVLTRVYDFDLIQAPLNIFDRRLVESGWARRLRRSGVELHTRSAFLQGLLLMPPNRRPEKFKRWADTWERWDAWLAELNLTPMQACVSYLNSIPEVDKFIVGVDSVDQLQEVLSVVEGSLNVLPGFSVLQDDKLLNPAMWKDLS